MDVGDLLQVALGEDKVDLLEGALLGLRVEKVDDRDEARVDDGKEEVCAPRDVGNHNRRDHDDEEIEQPVRASRHRVGAGAGAERVDFRGVQPWERKPGGAECGDICEETDACAFG